MISQSTKHILKHSYFKKSKSYKSKDLKNIEKQWQPTSWKQLIALQQPSYENQEKLVEQIINEIQRLPAMIKFDEIMKFKSDLTKVHNGDKFIIQLGDCAETFLECSEKIICKKIQFFQDVGSQFFEITNQAAVLIGRICGQFAKPRSNQYEKEGHFAYRGDLINGIDLDDRAPDPKRMLLGAMWQQAGIQVLKSSEENLINSLKQKIWISHECLHLDYESSLVRQSHDFKFYDSSAHFLWLGERTRAVDQAHVNFASGIYNPIGVKISSDITKIEFLQLNKILNPKNLINKLIIITRIGLQNIREILPQIVKWKKDANLNFLWMCDPMHGNTVTLQNTKTRLVTDIKNELNQFFVILHSAGERASGVHLEATPFDVSECKENELSIICPGGYQSACDPRLNQKQTFDVISKIGDLCSIYQNHQFEKN